MVHSHLPALSSRVQLPPRPAVRPGSLLSRIGTRVRQSRVDGRAVEVIEILDSDTESTLGSDLESSKDSVSPPTGVIDVCLPSPEPVDPTPLRIRRDDLLAQSMRPTSSSSTPVRRRRSSSSPSGGSAKRLRHHGVPNHSYHPRDSVDRDCRWRYRDADPRLDQQYDTYRDDRCRCPHTHRDRFEREDTTDREERIQAERRRLRTEREALLDTASSGIILGMETILSFDLGSALPKGPRIVGLEEDCSGTGNLIGRVREAPLSSLVIEESTPELQDEETRSTLRDRIGTRRAVSPREPMLRGRMGR